MEDYYKVLGVAYDDPPEKIKARYRLLALTVHPDVGGVGRTMEFTRYSQAYRVLSRQSERERYNETIGVFVKPRALFLGTDLYQRITISAAEAESGATVPLSFFRYEPCSLCWLSGCHRCNNQGMIAEKISLDVQVSPQSKNNAIILIEREGGTAEPGGNRGNLFVYIVVR